MQPSDRSHRRVRSRTARPAPRRRSTTCWSSSAMNRMRDRPARSSLRVPTLPPARLHSVQASMCALTCWAAASVAASNTRAHASRSRPRGHHFFGAEERRQHEAPAARHRQGAVQHRAGEHRRGAGGRADLEAGIFGEHQLAALEIVVEVERDGEGAVGGGRRAVVAMGAEEMLALGAVGQHDMGVEGELAVEGEDLGELGADAIGQAVGDRLLHHRLDHHVVLGALEIEHVDIAVAARDAAVLVVALFPQPDHLGAEVGLEHARQHQHGRHGRRAPPGRRRRRLRTAVGRGVHRLGAASSGAAVEGRGDPLVGIEHDHAHAQAAARTEADAALREQRGQELRARRRTAAGACRRPAELGPGRGRGSDGVAGDDDGRRPRRALQAAIRAANCSASRLLEIVDRDQRDRLAGERPDELAQLAVEAGQRRNRERDHRDEGRARWSSSDSAWARKWWAL